MVTPGMVGGQSGVLGHALSHVVVEKAYKHAPAQILLPMYMVKIVLEWTSWKVTAIILNVVKSHQVSYYICNQTETKLRTKLRSTIQNNEYVVHSINFIIKFHS